MTEAKKLPHRHLKELIIIDHAMVPNDFTVALEYLLHQVELSPNEIVTYLLYNTGDFSSSIPIETVSPSDTEEKIIKLTRENQSRNLNNEVKRNSIEDF